MKVVLLPQHYRYFHLDFVLIFYFFKISVFNTSENLTSIKQLKTVAYYALFHSSMLSSESTFRNKL